MNPGPDDGDPWVVDPGADWIRYGVRDALGTEPDLAFPVTFPAAARMWAAAPLVPIGFAVGGYDNWSFAQPAGAAMITVGVVVTGWRVGSHFVRHRRPPWALMSGVLVRVGDEIVVLRRGMGRADEFVAQWRVHVSQLPLTPPADQGVLELRVGTATHRLMLPEDLADGAEVLNLLRHA